MKLWLDDERPTPEGWHSARTAAFAIFILDHKKVEEISLDHDLGDTKHDPEWTGYTVLLHIESKVVWDESYHAPVIHIHTANSSARKKMELGRTSIERYMRMKQAVEEN
jgi:hypothetical protein